MAVTHQVNFSTLPSGKGDRRLALGVVLFSAALFVALAPFARTPLTPLPAFIPIYQTALVINDLVTAVLLLGHFQVARTRALLVLGCAFMFTAFVTILHTLTFPGLFSPTGLLGANAQTTAWLYMFWHAGFPLLVIAYAFLKRDGGRVVSILAMPAGILLAAAAAGGFLLLATVGAETLLPVIMDGNRYTGAMSYVVGTVWLLCLAALTVLWRARPHSVLDLWLMVVVCAWMFDIALSAVLNAGRFDLGFYAGRLYGLAAASFVLIVLLAETAQLYAASAQLAIDREKASAHDLLEAVVRQMPGGVIVADASGRRVLANTRAEQILGFAVLANYPEHQMGEVTGAIHADGRPFQAADFPLARALRGERLHDEEILFRHRDGAVRTLSVSAARIHDARRQLLGAVVSFVDITPRKHIEEERRQALDREQQARAEAEVANRSKDQFLAMLGHELRNPLAPIRTALQIMRLRGADALLKEREIIERQVEHLVRLVNDLLDVSRITSGKIDLERRPCELAEIVAKAIETASPIIEQRQHRLDVEVARHGIPVHCDSVRLSQVVANLLTNAAKFTPPLGEIRVLAAREGDHAVLRVRDNGVGFDAEMGARLFEPFVQGHQNLDRSQGGLGLGLAIVQSLVRMHNGAVEAHSAGPGKGAEFVIRLPAAEAAKAADAGEKVSAARVWPLEHAARVLIVDDNHDAAQMLASALRLHGLAIKIATDGPEALRVAREFRPQVALLDLGLPVMDGYELASQMRALAETATATLIAVTGYGEEADRRRTEAAGFAAHLVKPVDIADLLQAISARRVAERRSRA